MTMPCLPIMAPTRRTGTSSRSTVSGGPRSPSCRFGSGDAAPPPVSSNDRFMPAPGTAALPRGMPPCCMLPCGMTPGGGPSGTELPGAASGGCDGHDAPCVSM